MKHGKKKVISKIVVFCMTLGLIFCPITSMKAIASNYSIKSYEAVIDQVNEMYDTNIAITDFDLFSQNVYNKITPEEFMSLLTNISTDDGSAKSSVEVSMPSTRATNEVVSYYAMVNHGNWSSQVFADIETTFFTDSTPKFIRFVGAGVDWNANSSSWTYKPRAANCESFSSTTCKVKYNGNWVIPSTGVEDLTDITYRITYTAG